MRLVVVFIISLFVSGCGGGTNSLMDQMTLADRGWIQYQLDYEFYGDINDIELAYREGFSVGFEDRRFTQFVLRTDDEIHAYETGYCDGVWNRTGDY